MAVIRRLADSCITVTTQTGVTLIDPGFSTTRLSLVDRGFAYAIAHILGARPKKG